MRDRLAKGNSVPPTRIVRALISVGPLAATMAAYGLALDHLPDAWFKYGSLRYAFAAIAALCVGLTLKLWGEWHLKERSPKSSPDRHRKNSDNKVIMPTEDSWPSAASIFENTAHRLVTELRTVKRGDLELAGWSQFLDEKEAPPSAIGTAYGLRIVMALDIRDVRLNRARLAQSLLDLEKRTGGWAASSQRGAGRPEVTSWVLQAAIRAGIDNSASAKLIGTLERLIASDDAVGKRRTTVTASAICALSSVAPQSSLLAELTQNLIGGARYDNQDLATAIWGESISGTFVASTPHTARALIALDHARKVLPDMPDIERYLRAGLNWLNAGPVDLSLRTEQLRRPRKDGTVDVIVLGQFTPAWVARAMMLDQECHNRERLRATIVDILSRESDGVWRWPDGTTPIWMTYQAIAAVRQWYLQRESWLA